ncbi:MAG TPA: 50S ribosomal protein L22 [Candidatus Moranbacteria bacterium]|nr:50S ribosomal protein L22 [Candidatus Moranbacteria bacterium]
MKVSAKLKNLRIAPRKVRLTSDLIRGLDVAEALAQLEIHVKRTNPFMKKLLMSAISNGENNFGLDKNNLYVIDVIVDSGSTLKRWMPKAYGRAGEILKRTSKIELILEERVEGKGRKSKEEMEKEKAKREEERKKAEKAAAKEAEEGEKNGKEAAKKETKMVKSAETKESKKAENKGGIASKIFRRKSM